MTVIAVIIKVKVPPPHFRESVLHNIVLRVWSSRVLPFALPKLEGNAHSQAAEVEALGLLGDSLISSVSLC